MMIVLYWLFIGVILASLAMFFIKRARWVAQLRRDLVGEQDTLDLWMEVLVNGKP